MPFSNTVAQLNEMNFNNIKVTQQDYQQWQDDTLILDKIRGLRYGQSFCNHFGITDSTLYYLTADALAREWIENNYLRR